MQRRQNSVFPYRNVKKRKTSLQGSYTDRKVIEKEKIENDTKMDKGTCCFASFIPKYFLDEGLWKLKRRLSKKKGYLEGSMTLEASLVLPIFIIVMVVGMLFGEYLIVKGQMRHGLLEAAKMGAVNQYEYSEKGKTISSSFLQMQQKKYAQRDLFLPACKVSAVSLLGSKIGKEELDLNMSYFISISYPFVGTFRKQIKERVCQKAFTGYEPTAFEKGEGYSYVTKYGSVYHTSLECSHIMLCISDEKEMEKYIDGKTSYRPCKKCMKKGATGGQLYIPKDGDCYHNSLECSGLKRQVKKVTVWEVEGMKPCSGCAGG